MTLDEAIQHCKEVAENTTCAGCKKEHLQLAEWLQELKKRRSDSMAKNLIPEIARMLSVENERRTTKMIEFTVAGEPVAQGRPRFSTRGSFVKAYDPAKSKDYKAYVKLVAAAAMNERSLKPFDGAISVDIKAFVSVPKSKSKKFREAALICEIRPTKKPDCDNIAKILLDAMTGIVYEDDKQIVKLSVEKYYDEVPRVEVAIINE